ncbi:MAG: 50S ribosomal protein L6 [Simkania negevensis]|nr:50S ribosomal protein L6 [Simkania negevensis]
MSRLGKIPVPMPKGVEIKGTKGKIEIKGPKGSLSITLPEKLLLKIEGEQAVLTLEKEDAVSNENYGLYRSILKNAIIGVSTGFEKQLSLVGVGYRAAVKGEVLDLQLGYSHPSQVSIPKGVSVKIEKSVLIVISGIDKQLVGQFAADVRAIRPPEPYKGKGVRYVDEYVRKKAGKAAKGKTA